MAEQVRRIKAIVSTTEQHLHEQEGRIDAARAVAVRADLERLKQALDDPARNVHSLRQAIDRFFGKAS